MVHDIAAGGGALTEHESATGGCQLAVWSTYYVRGLHELLKAGTLQVGCRPNQDDAFATQVCRIHRVRNVLHADRSGVWWASTGPAQVAVVPARRMAIGVAARCHSTPIFALAMFSGKASASVQDAMLRTVPAAGTR
eukprot:4834588-Prymnesium_polylepis.1